MTITLELKPELDADLRELARSSGLPLATYVKQLIAEAVSRGRTDRAAALLDAWDEEDATQEPEVLERRRAEWEALKTAMKEGHSSDRTSFP